MNKTIQKAFNLMGIKKPFNNPLCQKPKAKFDVPPLDKIKSEHFEPAIDWAIDCANKRVQELRDEKNPTFANIIEAMEDTAPELGYVMGVYSNFSSVAVDDTMKEIESRVSEKLSKYGNAMMMDADIFKNVKAVYDNKDQYDLEPHQEKLLEDTYKGFVRSGALLDDAKKQELADLNIELGKLTTQFGTNVLESTNNFLHVVDDEKALDGMPASAIAAAKEVATAKGHDGKYAITLQAPSVMPVLKYATDRDLRETIWRAFTSQGTEAKTDNRDLVKQIVTLRDKKAKLLGYDTYADFVLEERMAQSKESVFKMIDDFKDTAYEAAQKDMEELKAFAAENGGPADIKQWDTAFYSEKLRQEKYGFKAEELREYFEFDKVEKGAFDVASKLYDLEFRQSSKYPKYHDETETYEVLDKESGDVIGILYTDFFPRDSKRGGAWMSAYRSQDTDKEGNRIPPIICIHGNFTKATEDTPSLLTMDEVRTYFHEFGHGLHGLLSDTQYESQSGTSVKWDFVELPSQLMENWAKEKEVMDDYAKSYKTGETIPEDMVEKMNRADQFQSGMFFLRQLSLANLDMQWHTTDPANIDDVAKFEIDQNKEFDLLPNQGNLISPQFGHLFAGGYAAGYYSYKWAEVLEADAFEAFKENGLFDKKTAQKFRKILESGGSVDPNKLYRDFRGKDADPKALLRREGLLKDASNENSAPANKTSAAPKK